MERTVGRAFDGWERPETLCNKTNLVRRTEIERPLFLNLNLYVHLLNIFTKHEFKLEMFMAVCWNYVKWCISIVRRTVPLVDHAMVKVSILALPYKSTPSIVQA